MLGLSGVLFAYAIGLRKISLFINIARWFITIEKFNDIHTLQDKNELTSLQQKKQLNHNPRTFFIILMCLFITIFAHIILLLSVFVYNRDFILDMLTFVHYYPMSFIIIGCFIWIFHCLKTFLNYQMDFEAKDEDTRRELRNIKWQTGLLFILICQREVVEIVSYSIWPPSATKIPNPLQANLAFSIMNYPSIMIYVYAYIKSLSTILESSSGNSNQNQAQKRAESDH